MQRRQGQSRTEEILALVTAILYLVITVWLMLPEYQRRLLAARALARLQRGAGLLAAAQGLEGMRDELAGREHSAEQFYRTAYRLGMFRDRLGRAIEELHP